MKKLLKISLALAALLLVLCLCAVWFLTSAPGENLVKGWLESRLSSEIGLPVSIGRFETDLWSRVQFDTLVARPAAGPSETPVLYVSHLSARYSITELLGDTITLKALVVDSVVLGLEVDSLGRFGIPVVDDLAAEVEGEVEPAAAIAIDSIMLGRIGLSYRDSQLPLTVDVSGTRVAVYGNRDGSYSGRLGADGVSMSYDSLALVLRNLDIAGAIDDSILRLDHATAVCEGIQLGLAGDVGLAGSQPLSLRATAEGDFATLASHFAADLDSLNSTTGYAKLDCRIGGTVTEPSIFLDGRFQELSVQKLQIDSAMVQASYANDSITIEDFSLSALGGRLSGTGLTTLDSVGVTEADITLDRIGLSDLWVAVYNQVSPYRGRLNGTINLRGKASAWDLWQANATLSGENISYENQKIPDLTCQANLESGRTVISLVHGADEITADLVLSADSLRGAFDVSVPNLTGLARFANQPELAGGIWAEGVINGSYANPNLRVTVRGSEIAYRGFPVDTLAAEVSFADSLLTVGSLTCAGRLDSVSPGNPPFGIDSISGAFSYECALSGPLDNLQGALFGRLIAPRYSHYSLDSLAGEVTLDGPMIAVSRLEASAGSMGAGLEAVFDTVSGLGSFNLIMKSTVGSSTVESDSDHHVPVSVDDLGSLSGQFSVNPDATFAANVEGDRLWLGLITMFQGDSVEYDGYADFDLDIGGPILTPDVNLAAKVRSLAISGYKVDSLAANVRLDSAAIHLDSLTSYALGHTLRASGQVDLDVAESGFMEIAEDGSLEVTFDARDFDLSAISALVLPEGELAGRASAELRGSGKMSSPSISGWMTLDEGMVMLDSSSPPVEGLMVSLSLADSVLTVDSVTCTASEVSLRVDGTLTTSQFELALVDLAVRVGSLGRLDITGLVSEDELDLELVSDTINLAVFESFVPDLDSLSGRLTGRLTLRGAPPVPDVDGDLRISSLAFRSPKQGISLAEGYAEVQFDGNQIQLDSAAAKLNGGEFALSGALAHDKGDLVDLDLIARVSHVMLEEPGVYSMAIDSAALDYRKQNEVYVLSGDILLGEARYTEGLRPTSVLPWVQSIETVDMELPELVARSRLNVRIRESNNLWVDNNLARIRLRAEVGIIGTPLRPNFTGLVRIEEGYLLYLDRRFRVNEGTVFFTDPTRFNPDINLEARTEVTVYRRTNAEPYTIYIRANGLLDQLQYGLYSEPELDRPDIVALLTLGATRTELTSTGDENGGSGLTQALKDRAAMLTSQRVSGYLSRKAGAMFGFDEFTIRGNLFQFDESWGPQLVASKRLTRKVALTYSTTVGQLNDQAVRLGYYLTPRWSLMGETDRQGRSGLDLRFGLTFK